jgi:hypothetical protein
MFRIYKMHGLGNDFMVVDLISQRAIWILLPFSVWLIVILGLVLINF